MIPTIPSYTSVVHFYCSLHIPTWLWKSNLISQPPNFPSFLYPLSQLTNFPYFPISVLESPVFEPCGLKHLRSSLTFTCLMFCAVSAVSKTILRTNGLLKELMGLRKAIILVVLVYCNERIQIKIRKKKDALGKVQEKPGTSFQKFFSPGGTWMSLLLWTMMCDNVCKYCQPGKLNWDVRSRIFIGGQLCRHAVPAWLMSATQSDSRSPGENRHSP